MGEVSVAVPAVAEWLRRVSAEKVALLVGCGFHDGIAKGVETVEVIGVDAARATVLLASGARVRLASPKHADGEFVDTRPGAPLAAAVRSSQTPAEMREEAERGRVRQAGFDPGKLPSAEARAAVLEAVDLLKREEQVSAELRSSFYAAVTAAKDPAMARAAASMVRNMVGAFGGEDMAPEDLHWRLAVLLRLAGRLEEAVVASEVLFDGRPWSARARLFLASTRASAMLDLAQARPTPELLAGAGRALDIALACETGQDRRALFAMREILRRLEAETGLCG